MNAHQIILRPLITEKNTNLMVFNKYSFEVDRNANKAHRDTQDFLCRHALVRKIEVRDDQPKCWKSRLQDSSEAGRNALLAPEHQTVVQTKLQ